MGKPLPQIALPVFGCKSHIAIDRRFGFIRESAYRSQKNEKWLAAKLFVSRIHRRKPAGKPMPLNIARANAAKYSICARIEHVFAHQKNRFGLFIRTIGIKRAEAKLTLANIACNSDRLIFHERARPMG